MTLKAAGVYKSYNSAGNVLEVLKGINIDIEEGEYVSIVGPSGAGKSTLLHILGGLDAPNKGIVYINKDNIYHLNDVDRAKLRNNTIGFVFQFYHLLPEFTALENVILPALIQKDSKNVSQFRDEGLSLLEIIGLKNRSEHKPSQLSGGEQQRVAIARALMNKPSVILCDEPTGNLDSKSGDEIINILKELNEKHNNTIVIVTHDERIAKQSNRIINIVDGKII